MKKIFINYEQMHGYVLDLIRQLSSDNWTPDYIVGVSKGGLLPAMLISEFLEIPMYTVRVNVNGDSESACWIAEDAFNRKNILVVNDLNDGGNTIAWLKNDWRQGCLPQSGLWDGVWGDNVRVAVIVNNIASCESVNYYATEINKVEEPCTVIFPTEQWWKQ